MKHLAVCCESIDFIAQAKSLADDLQLILLEHQDDGDTREELLLLCVTRVGIGLKPAGGPQKPVCVDFVGGAVGHRTRSLGQGAELIAKAVGVRGQERPYVVDATAGLGRDAFVLASLGCRVLMLENHPVIAVMLRDGMLRASQDLQACAAVNRMTLCATDALDWLKGFDKSMSPRPEVVYLDPMFAPRSNTAKVKKDMQVMHRLLAGSGDGAGLLDAALKVSGKRVVVKRPAKAPPLQEKEPDFSVGGKSSRFDVYLIPPGMRD